MIFFDSRPGSFSVGGIRELAAASEATLFSYFAIERLRLVVR